MAKRKSYFRNKRKIRACLCQHIEVVLAVLVEGYVLCPLPELIDAITSRVRVIGKAKYGSWILQINDPSQEGKKHKMEYWEDGCVDSLSFWDYEWWDRFPVIYETQTWAMLAQDRVKVVNSVTSIDFNIDGLPEKSALQSKIEQYCALLKIQCFFLESE